MFKRQRSGSVICTSCGVLVGVDDDRCYNCNRRNPGLWGFAPALRSLGQDLGFVPFVIGTSVILYGLTLVFSAGQIGMGGMFGFLSPSNLATFLFGASGGGPVFGAGLVGDGSIGLWRWWTVLSAGWLHGSALHILFNMMWVRQLAPATADIYGPGRMVIIYTAAGAAGFALSSVAAAFLPAIPLIPGLIYLRGGTFSVGASASIFGLLGALVYYGRRGGSRMVGSQAFTYALLLGLFGLVMPGIDNYAHAGGFGGGYLAARLLDPLTRERTDHVLVALGCLAASLLAVVASILHGMQIYNSALR